MDVVSQVQPPLTQKEIKSLFVDTLLPPYYDKLIGNVVIESKDLVYAMGRIDDGIKRGKIKNLGSKIESKDNYSSPFEYAQAATVGNRNENIVEYLHYPPYGVGPSPHHCFSTSDWLQLPSDARTLNHVPLPQMPTSSNEQNFSYNHRQVRKRKKDEMNFEIPMSYKEIFPFIVQNYQISIIPTKP